MFDFIHLEINIDCKDTMIFANMQQVAAFASGYDKYIVHGLKDMEIFVNRNTNRMRVKGSLPYWQQGHNFTFSQNAFVEAVQQLNSYIPHVNLWQSRLLAFEYGVIMQVEQQPKEYIKNHTTNDKGLIEEVRAKDRGFFKWWENKAIKLKMYDVNHNFSTTNKLEYKNKEAAEAAGWDKSKYWLKFEGHYLNPELIEGGKGAQLWQLDNTEFLNNLKDSLYMQYKRLEPVKETVLTDKPQTNELVMSTIIDNFADKETIKKLVYAKINQNPTLSKSDKDQRKRTFKKMLEGVGEKQISRYDLSAKLKEVLNDKN